MLDILFVTYNAKKWLDDCVGSLAKSDYDLKSVTLNFVDNASSDGTVDTLNALREKYAGTFGAFRVERSEKNLGFGGGNNRAAQLGSGDIVLCMNTDTTVYPDTLRAFMADIEASDEHVGMWEMRQFPYEHPKFYDPFTLETSWCTGACLAMRRNLWEKIGGFDEHIFLYVEDVDLSWRVRAEGYALRYVPKACINHYSYESAGEIKPNQFIQSIVSNRYLRVKFAGEQGLAEWSALVEGVYASPEPFPGAHSAVRKALAQAEDNLKYARAWYDENRDKLTGKTFRFIGWDYETIRDGAFFVCERQSGEKKVSVLVRTCGRPAMLRETLVSLREQTYPNVEVVVVEDGENVSEAMLRAEFSDLNLIYRATGKRVGRCAAGNLALSLATGDYLCFLDDDDLFYADHIETLMTELARNPGARVAYALAFETPIRVLSRDPYRYEVQSYNGTLKNRFNRLALTHHNLFPIQAVLFAREVYEEFGGLDESMDLLEDWDLWFRYATKYAFVAAWKTTSVYRVPMDEKTRQERHMRLHGALAAWREKQKTYPLYWNSAELLEDCEALLEEERARIAQAPAPAGGGAAPTRGLLYRAARGGFRRIKGLLYRLPGGKNGPVYRAAKRCANALRRRLHV